MMGPIQTDCVTHVAMIMAYNRGFRAKGISALSTLMGSAAFKALVGDAGDWVDDIIAGARLLPGPATTTEEICALLLERIRKSFQENPLWDPTSPPTLSGSPALPGIDATTPPT